MKVWGPSELFLIFYFLKVAESVSDLRCGEYSVQCVGKSKLFSCLETGQNLGENMVVTLGVEIGSLFLNVTDASNSASMVQ